MKAKGYFRQNCLANYDYPMPFAVRSIGCTTMKAGEADIISGALRHPSLEISWTISGCGEIIHYGQPFEMRRNDVFLFLPDETHHYRVKSREWHWRWLCLDGPLAVAMLLACRLPRKISCDSGFPEALFRRIEENISTDSPGMLAELSGTAWQIIARLIGRNVSTVSREIRRNCTHMYDIPTYYPHTAQKKYLLRRSYCHRGMFHSQEVIDYIDEKLRATWSPEQIACTPCELNLPSWRTIYRWIYEKYLVNGNLKVLRRKGKSHGVKETRGKYNKGKSIRKRDKSVYSRQEAGHWEADTVVSGQGKSKACFATLAERKTRFYIAVKMPDRRAETMENAIVSALSGFPSELVKTITCDRGTEFANWRRIEERLHCEVYFADPYCAWQKGTNENLNGLLREFYPKGRNLSRVAPATLKRNLALINARPRKVLNFHSAQELWDAELNSCCT